MAVLMFIRSTIILPSKKKLRDASIIVGRLKGKSHTRWEFTNSPFAAESSMHSCLLEGIAYVRNALIRTKHKLAVQGSQVRLQPCV